jgi:hypothetical protein
MSKKSCIDFSLQKTIRDQRRVLTRYHHVDVRQFVAQDLQGFGHSRQLVSGQKAHDEAWFGGISDSACSSGCRFNMRIAPGGRIREARSAGVSSMPKRCAFAKR